MSEDKQQIDPGKTRQDPSLNQGAPQPVHPNYAWPVAVVLIFFFGLVAYLYSVRQGEKAMRGVVESVGNLAARFSQHNINTTFTASIPAIFPVPGGNLELATAHATESFARSDAKYTAWNWIYLGTTVSEIKVPVTYRYHLRLNDLWKLETQGQKVRVKAPRIRASLPPAIHTDRMEKRSEAGWARFDAREKLDELERTVTPTLERYANDAQHVMLVREQCRKTVAEFVRNWLMREEQWRPDGFQTIDVVFEDETGTGTTLPERF